MVIHVNLSNLQTSKSYFSLYRSEVYTPIEDNHIYKTGNISFSGVPGMIVSDQVDFGIGRYAMISSRQPHIDFTSVAFSQK
jgi:hypothetical protein